MPLVRLETTTLRSRVKHSTTEPLRCVLEQDTFASVFREVKNNDYLFHIFVLKHEYLPGPQGYKTFSCLTQLSTKFIMLINVKMPTNIGILTFISMINN